MLPMLSIPASISDPKTYRARQPLFAYLIASHILWLYASGYEVTCADFYSTVVCGGAGHMANSQHAARMAADLNIFKAGRWMDGRYADDKSDWEKIGAAWEALHPLCRWGGRFKQVDLNHFSLVSADGKRA